jgi:hypothetical protein
LESYSLVLHRLGARTAIQWLEEVLAGSSLVNPTSEDYMQSIAKVAALPGQGVTLFDAMTAVLSGRLGVATWTYDHHFDVMRCNVWRP